MVRRKRNVPQRGGRQQANSAGGDEPDIYQEMLTEVGVAAPAASSSERPLKRRREGAPSHTSSKPAGPKEPTPAPITAASRSKTSQGKSLDEEDEDDDDDAEFEDVAIPEPTIQTVELGSDDDEDDEDEDLRFEDVDVMMPPPDGDSEPQEPKELELNLSAQKATMTSKQAADRRKPITKEERERRLDIHKAHLICLLSHVARRNHWCNDPQVQSQLRSLLTDKMVQYLTPGTNLSQFGRTESLKNGLKLVAEMWTTKYEITERGMRRSLWAEEVDHLSSYEPPNDMESCLDKSDFREAAKTLQGSRDVGAQLYCALLRSIGIRARLVCSLQPLSFGSTGPTLPKPKGNLKPKAAPNKTEQMLSQVAKYREMANAVSSATSSAGPSTARRRLGHPNASDYNFEPRAAPHRPHQSFEAPKRIRESPYPVYWVEILDVGHQKWQPTDPVVMNSFWKPKIFEPPITDKENSLSYVIAFNADGTARDVTRRYAKAYTAKTRKLRIETALDDGRRWWNKVMKMYLSKTPSDLDQIEDVELAGAEAREPMPRNVQDFKDHPVYALERHLRRHEVLIPGAVPSGTVAAGARAPLEKVFRRKDVRVARSAEKWFRLGREVKPMEIPAKWLPKRVTSKRSRFGKDEQGEDEDGDAGTPVYTMDQTELYEPAPVRNGRVPKNKFGNIEVYVPSMVPKGGVHIADEYARRAAYVLGVDCAPALTGFSFKGRQGTAVLSGVVIAKEFEEAVRAGIQGMLDLEQEVEDEKRRYMTLKLWRRFMMGLRIRERIWSGVGEEERQQADRDAEFEAWAKGAESDETEEFDMVVDDEDDGGGGGFLVGDDDADEGGGGFLVE